MSRTLTLREELSPNEQKMFKDLGWEYLFHVDNFNPMSLYSMAVEKVFAENEQFYSGPTPKHNAILALRKAINNFRSSPMKYRGNPEFEELISYE